MTPSALEGMKVVEYCNMVSGPYCGKLLADMGADVFKIEQPHCGDDSRRRGPFPDDIPHQEKSGLFLYLNSNKKGLTLDTKKSEGKKIFKKLIEKTDVLIEDRSPGEMEALGLDYEKLKAINPDLIMISITPFGRSGSFKDYKAYQLNTVHASGQGYMLPIPALDMERPPVKVGGHSSEFDVGLVAVVAVTAAFYWKVLTGQGQFIEVSKQEALMSMQRVESVTFANDQVVLTRGGERVRRTPGGILPCKDGYVVAVTPEEHQWHSLVKLIGDPEWAKEDWCQNADTRAENAEKINELVIEWTMKHTKEEIFRQGQALSCPIAPVNTAEDIYHSEQFKARNFFVDVEHPAVGKMPFPSASFRFSKTPWKLKQAAPLLGEHNEAIYGDRLGYSKEELSNLRNQGVI
ncbi:MAG: CoA transferase [Thermodesulfobacteriota bacterium]|jgi:crotonobetainyl-CoA:carnitine CoA-transferase CaiB-like acyl-CoA transferase